MNQSTALFDEIIGMLAECDLFNSLTSTELRSIAPHFGILNLTEQQMIFQEGEDGAYMGIIHSGRVRVLKKNQFNQDVIMASIGKNRTFGEMAVLDGERRSASCIAEEDCVLLTLSKTAMDAMLEAQPRIGAKVLRSVAVSLSRRLRLAVGKLVDHEL